MTHDQKEVQREGKNLMCEDNGEEKGEDKILWGKGENTVVVMGQERCRGI